MHKATLHALAIHKRQSDKPDTKLDGSSMCSAEDKVGGGRRERGRERGRRGGGREGRREVGGEREREGGWIEEREPRITHLIFRWKIFNRLLHHSTAVGLETKHNHVTLQMLAEFLNLVRVSKLEEFLDYIVTK